MNNKFSIGHYVMVKKNDFMMQNLTHKVGRVTAIKDELDGVYYHICFDDVLLNDPRLYIREDALQLFRKFKTGDRIQMSDSPFLLNKCQNRTGIVTGFKTNDFGGSIEQIVYDVRLDGDEKHREFDSRYIQMIERATDYNRMYRRTEMKTINDSIEKVIFNGDRTIILWNDDTKTMVKCADDEEFDYYSGFCAAVTKKIFGSTANAQRFMESKMVDQNNTSKPLTGIIQTFDEAINKIVERIENINALIRVDDMYKEMLELYAKYDADKVDEALKTYIQNHKK